MRVIKRREFWPGTASELLRSLETHAGDERERPKAGRNRHARLSTALRRIGPQLRMVGMIIEFDRSRERFVTITGGPKMVNSSVTDQPIGALG